MVKKGNVIRMTLKDTSLGIITKNYTYLRRSNKYNAIYVMDGKNELYIPKEDIIKIKDLKI